MADRVKALAKQYQKQHPGALESATGLSCELPNRRWDNTARRRGYQTVAGTVPLRHGVPAGRRDPLDHETD
ncbi:hypothetical protein [Acidiferrobacter sp.]|jgi:hypothetical protein|uniref:hypothetical protein n=1 Tax=Acidiferrobacter sp. TaxID=1872107 RepID=UPI00262BFEEE|nr:hypothetical protein [Acidiferrobacter sp.]